jgi:predicted DNA-binding transcriptional regulator YafY
MDKFDRIQRLHRQFKTHHYPIPLKQLAERLECSTKTVQRDIDLLRYTINAPVMHCDAPEGWHYQPQAGDAYELPGLWLTSQELQCLILLLHLLKEVGQGLLNQELAIIEKQIDQLLQARGIARHQLNDKIKIIALGNRHMLSEQFEKIVSQLLQQHDLHIAYGDFNQRLTQRQVSPQRLVFYRENWYLDAWCHQRQSLRTFAIARIQSLTCTDIPITPVDAAQLNAHFAQGYGLFAGPAPFTACLRFLPRVAHEIASQHWHPDQHGEWIDEDYRLHIPYADPSELLLDILRYTPDVIVESPPELREAVIQRLEQGLRMYQWDA